MKVFFVSSEVTPFASTGGLADVAHALPAALQRAGVETLRVMPYYRQVPEAGIPMEDTGIRLQVPLGMYNVMAEVWATTDTTPKTYFIRRDEYFDRTHLYSMPHRDYEDNLARFLFFQKCTVDLIDALGFVPDIVHCNDWQTGLLPLYLQYGVHGMGRAGGEKTVFTIHNLAYQGLFDAALFSMTNLPFSSFSVEGFEFYGQINCMKGGIAFSDQITTVSQAYADEIQTEEFGCGLGGFLAEKGDRLAGILNGVDYTAWNPETDPALKSRFNAENLRGKANCRRALANQFGLDLPTGRPLIGMVTRLTEQKGLDIIAQAIEAIMEQNLAVVLLGSGEQRYHELCDAWAAKWSERFAVSLTYDPDLAHQIEGGADMFLMPSRFEPCGLNQLYSLKYGTLPIVHATGGLKDTITDLTRDAGRGNGFSFDSYTPAALVDAIERACASYAKRNQWLATVRRVMTEDHSWDVAAESYVDVYEKCLNA